MSRVGDADIEIAVGRENDPVDRLFVEVPLGQGVSLANASRARGRTTRSQSVQGGQDLLIFGHLGRFQHRARGTLVVMPGLDPLLSG